MTTRRNYNTDSLEMLRDMEEKKTTKQSKQITTYINNIHTHSRWRVGAQAVGNFYDKASVKPRSDPIRSPTETQLLTVGTKVVDGLKH